MKIGTFNVRGLLDKQKLEDLTEDLESYDLDILAVQETHIRGTHKIALGNKYTLYNTGSIEHSYHGVGIIVKNKYSAKFVVISERVCKITVESPKFKTTVISAYAPTLTKSHKQPKLADNFYSDLQLALDQTPKYNHIFIGLDANAQLGKNHHFPNQVGPFGHGYLNSNGERLGYYLTNNRFIATNTFFQHKVKHRTTWTHPNSNPIDKKNRKT